MQRPDAAGPPRRLPSGPALPSGTEQDADLGQHGDTEHADAQGYGDAEGYGDEQQRDRLLADAVACAGDAFVTTDLDGIVTTWNRAAQELLGWSPDEVVGQPLARLVPQGRVQARPGWGGAGADPSTGAAATVPGLTGPGLVETLRLHRSGRLVPVEVRSAPLRDRAGRVVGTVTVARDPSPQLRPRAELEQTRVLAQHGAHSVLAQLTLDGRGRISAVNPALCALSGYDEQDLLGQPYRDFVVREQLDEVAERWDQRARGRSDQRRRVRRLRRADGSVVETLVTVVEVPEDGGSPARTELAVEDLSAVLAAERAARTSEARWRSLAVRASDVAFLVDARGTVRFVTPSFSQHFGFDESWVVGRSGLDLVHPEDQPAWRALWRATVEPGSPPVTFRGRIRHADGTWRWVEQKVTNRLDDPDVGAMVVNVLDISDIRAAQERLALLSETDQLTGLLVRRGLIARLEQALLAGPGEQVALVVADLDGFGVVNAVHGHGVGDEVLVAVAERLSRVARRHEALGRIAGDRFALVLTELSDPEALAEVVQRITSVLQQPVTVRGHELTLTATVAAVPGVAADPGVVVDSAALVDAAEATLSAARRHGPAQVRVETAVPRSKMLARAAVLDDLRRGLRRGELVVHYQPVIDLRSGRPRGAEALVRWAHPQRGLLLPADFIAAAEDSGQIVALGEQVLLAACARAQQWASRPGGEDFTVAVNLSARQIAAPDVVETVRRALRTTGCAGRSLVLEVTESAVMADLAAARETLEALRALGVELAVDDFGTGYSSLTYLKQFPVSTLKVDRSFVSGLGVDADDTAIVTSVIGLAATIGLDCVAEGVETPEQATTLLALGCTAGQGHVWARAMPDQALDRWLLEQPHPATRQAETPAPARSAPLDPAVLHRMAEMQREGASLHTIAAALNAEGVPTTEGKRWHARSVARVVQTLRAD